MEKIILSEEQMGIIVTRTAKIVQTVLEAYNLELSTDNRLQDPTLEVNAVYRSLGSITLSVMASICQDNGSLLETLGDYINVLEAIGVSIEELKEDAYIAGPPKLGSEEVRKLGS
jgi:hypothetical protein